MKTLAVFIIKTYKKYISPFLLHSCRFYPSCSSYCLEALQRYGLLRGLWLFLKRVVKCHPFNPGGYDPVERQRVKYKGSPQSAQRYVPYATYQRTQRKH